jgi:hypothetical protein
LGGKQYYFIGFVAMFTVRLVVLSSFLLVCCGSGLTVASADVSRESGDDVQISRIAFVFAGSARSFVMPTLHELLRQNLIAAFCPPGTRLISRVNFCDNSALDVNTLFQLSGVRDNRKCIADVFVRLSTSDNNHQGASAVGVFTQGSKEVLDRANSALRRLHLGQAAASTVSFPYNHRSLTATNETIISPSQRRLAGSNPDIEPEEEQYARTTTQKTYTLAGPGSYGGVLNVQYVDIGSNEEMLEMIELENKARVTRQKLGAKHKIYRILDPRRYSMYFHRW